ncbi:hypothetical protein CLOM_g1649 [Closterium sp. NIES-68]|nr:hypothetical protein CLOM_g1649 [Closterium sp. NIES-68]
MSSDPPCYLPEDSDDSSVHSDSSGDDSNEDTGERNEAKGRSDLVSAILQAAAASDAESRPIGDDEVDAVLREIGVSVTSDVGNDVSRACNAGSSSEVGRSGRAGDGVRSGEKEREEKREEEGGAEREERKENDREGQERTERRSGNLGGGDKEGEEQVGEGGVEGGLLKPKGEGEGEAEGEGEGEGEGEKGGKRERRKTEEQERVERDEERLRERGRREQVRERERERREEEEGREKEKAREEERRREAESERMRRQGTGKSLWAHGWLPGKRHADEDENQPEWRQHGRHFLVVTNAGKPVFSRYGDEYKLAAFGGVLQALVAYVESTGDHIRSISAGLHQVLFLVRGSFYLVAITDAGEPEPIIERQLDHLHKMLLMLLTSAIERSFLRNPKFDIRPLLGGTDRLFSALIHSFSWDPASYLSSMRCLRIPAWVRTTVSGAIKTAAAASPALFALVFSGFEVVTVANRTREPLHSDDIFLLLTFLNASDSFRTSPESFTPVCLPHYNPSAFLYAYVHYWAADQPLPPTPHTIHSHSISRSKSSIAGSKGVWSNSIGGSKGSDSKGVGSSSETGGSRGSGSKQNDTGAPGSGSDTAGSGSSSSSSSNNNDNNSKNSDSSGSGSGRAGAQSEAPLTFESTQKAGAQSAAPLYDHHQSRGDTGLLLLSADPSSFHALKDVRMSMEQTLVQCNIFQEISSAASSPSRGVTVHLVQSHIDSIAAAAASKGARTSVATSNSNSNNSSSRSPKLSPFPPSSPRFTTPSRITTTTATTTANTKSSSPFPQRPSSPAPRSSSPSLRSASPSRRPPSPSSFTSPALHPSPQPPGLPFPDPYGLGPGMGCDIIPMGQSEDGADEDDDYSRAFDQSENRGVFGGGGEGEGAEGWIEGQQAEEEGDAEEEEEDEEEEDGAVLALEKLRSVLGGGMGMGMGMGTDQQETGSPATEVPVSVPLEPPSLPLTSSLPCPPLAIPHTAQTLREPSPKGGGRRLMPTQTPVMVPPMWGPQGLLHFVFKSVPLRQFVMAEFPPALSDKRQQKNLLRAYQTMHSSMTTQTPVTAANATVGATSATSSALSASSSSTSATSLLASMELGGSCPVPGGIKTQYRRTKDFILLSWRTPDFEIMAAFDPLATKKPAIAVCNAICHMLQQLESELFLPGSVIF